jgi:hypothetical protein
MKNKALAVGSGVRLKEGVQVLRSIEEGAGSVTAGVTYIIASIKKNGAPKKRILTLKEVQGTFHAEDFTCRARRKPSSKKPRPPGLSFFDIPSTVYKK